MLTLSTALAAHQKTLRRQPAVSVSLECARFAVPVLPIEAMADTSGDGDCQLSIAIPPDDPDQLLAVRTNGTALDYQDDYPNTGSWTNLDTVTAGQGFQLAYDQVNAVFGLAYGDGNDVKFRTTADGTTWSAATTVVTEASAIGAVALAFDDIGDACLFYVLGTSTTLKRLRRTSGSWAASGTTWSKSASVANLTGLSAVWHSDYILAVTGNEVTTTHRRLWAVEMGDTILPTNAWSGLKAIAEADAASGVTFSYPSLCEINSVYFVAYQREEANNVVSHRAMLSHAMPSAGPLGWWAEPRPIPGVTTTHGAALAYYPDVDAIATPLAWVAGPRKAYVAPLAWPAEVSASLLALSWKLTADSPRARLEFDNIAGAHPFRLGRDLVISHGYLIENEPEYGTQLRVNIHKITDRLQLGKRTVIIEASGPWEALDRFRSMAAWTAPSTTTRGAIFQRVAALAGIEVGEASSTRAPSTAWSTDTPAFAIAVNERGSTTLRRLLEVTPDFIRPSSGGGFEVCGFTDTAYVEEIAIPQRPINTTLLPLLHMELSDELAPNWLRLQGPDRYADDFDELVDDGTDILALGPMGFTVRDQDAGTDAKAQERASNARLRALQLVPRGQLVTHAHVGIELFDIVRAQYNASPLDGLEQARGRVIGLALDYRTGPAGRAAYTSTLDLADYQLFS